MSHNNLSGRIPTFSGELTSLQNFNLSYNLFEGEVPSKGLFKNVSAFSVEGNINLCGGVEERQLPACPEVLRKKKRPLDYKVILPVITISFVVVILFCVAAHVFGIRRSRNEIPKG